MATVNNPNMQTLLFGWTKIQQFAFKGIKLIYNVQCNYSPLTVAVGTITLNILTIVRLNSPPWYCINFFALNLYLMWFHFPSLQMQISCYNVPDAKTVFGKSYQNVSWNSLKSVDIWKLLFLKNAPKIQIAYFEFPPPLLPPPIFMENLREWHICDFSKG